MSDFAIFIGKDDQSTMEHVGQFWVQCGEVGTYECLRLRLFPSSLSNTVFTWYTNLLANLIYNRAENEMSFIN